MTLTTVAMKYRPEKHVPSYTSNSDSTDTDVIEEHLRKSIVLEAAVIHITDRQKGGKARVNFTSHVGTV